MLFNLFCSVHILEDTPLTSFCASMHASKLRVLFNTFPSFSILSSSFFTESTGTSVATEIKQFKLSTESSKYRRI